MINSKEFIPKETRWQDIFSYLKSLGYEVYSPSIKVGECLSNYIVVKSEGAVKHASFSSYIELYSVLCYVPKEKYSSLNVFVNMVKESMKGLEPLILPYGEQTPSYYDDGIKAHMISIKYKNYKKI